MARSGVDVIRQECGVLRAEGRCAATDIAGGLIDEEALERVCSARSHSITALEGWRVGERVSIRSGEEGAKGLMS